MGRNGRGRTHGDADGVLHALAPEERLEQDLRAREDLLVRQQVRLEVPAVERGDQPRARGGRERRGRPVGRTSGGQYMRVTSAKPEQLMWMGEGQAKY